MACVLKDDGRNVLDILGNWSTEWHLKWTGASNRQRQCAAFVVEHDWVASAVILILGLCMVMYNTFQIRAVQERDYTVSFAHKVEVVVRYYVDPLLGVVWVLSLPFKRWCSHNGTATTTPSEVDEENVE